MSVVEITQVLVFVNHSLQTNTLLPDAESYKSKRCLSFTFESLIHIYKRLMHKGGTDLWGE